MTREQRIEQVIKSAECFPDLIRELLQENKRLRAELEALAKITRSQSDSRELVAAQRSMDGFRIRPQRRSGKGVSR